MIMPAQSQTARRASTRLLTAHALLYLLPVLSRVFEYWKNVDPDLGKKVEEGVRGK